MIFTVPALVIMGYWPDFKYWWVCAIAGLGGLLGVLFSVPLRRSLIVDQQMAFPEGKAAAEVLRAGENPKEGVKVLGVSALIGGIGKMIAASGMRLVPDSALASGFIGKYLGYMGTNISPALLGVGYIVGLNIGIVVVSGSILSFNIAIPIYHAYFLAGQPGARRDRRRRLPGPRQRGMRGDDGADPARRADPLPRRRRHAGRRPVGVDHAAQVHRVGREERPRRGARRQRCDRCAHRSRPADEVGADRHRRLHASAGDSLLPIIVGSVGVGLAMSVIMVVAGFLFCSVSAYMAGLVGSSNNPVSGITIATILFAALVLLGFLGKDSTIGPVAAVMIGAVVCCAACVAGDNLQDLKAGYLVGATPWRQQVMLAIGSVCCALVMAPVLNMLARELRHRPAHRRSIRVRSKPRRPISWRRSPRDCSAGTCRGR